MIQQIDETTRFYSTEEAGDYSDCILPENYEVFLKTDNLHDQQKIETFLEWVNKLTPDELEKRLSGTK